MGKIKKILCMLLVCAIVIVPCSVFGSVSAQTDDTEPLKVEITTDKNSYSLYDVSKINVKITNISDETVNNITAQAIFDELTPVGNDSTTSIEGITLKANKSIEFSYSAMINENKFNLNLFEKIALWFMRLFKSLFNNVSVYDRAYENAQFSGKYDLEKSIVIKFGNYGAKNDIKICYDDGMQQNWISDIFSVNDFIDNIQSSSEYKETDDTQKKAEMLIDSLNELANQGLVYKSSIYYNKNLNQITFKYICGVTTYILLSPIDDMIAGTSKSNITELTNKDFSFVKESALSTNNLKSTEQNKNLNAVIAYGFREPGMYNTNYHGESYSSYSNFAKELLGKGINAKAYNCPTVEMFKTAFLNQDFVCIVEHGVELSPSEFSEVDKTTYGFIVANEDITKDTYNNYIKDVENNLIVPLLTPDGKYRYAIVPDFFSYHYNGKLNDTIVYLGYCMPFGAGISYNFEFARTLYEDCNAKTVYGYHNSVLLVYQFAVFKSLIENLLDGQTTKMAYNSAIEECGENDCIYFENNKSLFPGKSLPAERPKASLCIYGDKDWSIASTFSATVNIPLNDVEVSAYLESEKNKADKTIYTFSTDKNGKVSGSLPIGEYIFEFSFGDSKAYKKAIITRGANADLGLIELVSDSNYIEVICSIKDNNNTPLEKVNVCVKNTGSGIEIYNVASDINGEIKVLLTPGNNYEFTFVKEGYQSITKSVNILATETISKVLSINMTSSGEIEENQYGTLTETGSCGDNAFYDFYEETGTLVIRGTGEMTNWNNKYSVPWNSEHSKIKTVIVNNGITSIGKCVFEDCNSLTSITIPDSVTRIGERAFSDCDVLTTIIIPESIKSIGDYAFSFSESLSSITIPNTVTTIGAFGFRDCINLTTIQLGKNVTSIGLGAFTGCNRLTSVTVDSENTVYSSDEYGVLFNKEKTQLIKYPAGNERIYYKIPDTVKSVSISAFEHCESLTNIQIGKGVTSIGNAAFENCSALTSITIPDSVSTIGHFAFQYCDSLTDVQIGKGVINIGNNAFSSCNSLSSITIPDNVTSIGYCVFSSCSSLTGIIVDEANEYYSSDEHGVLFNKDKTVLIQYPCGSKRKSYEIPYGVTTIGSNAFNNCSGLTNVTVGNSVTSIENYAFFDCINLASITIGNSVTNIGESVFVYCNNLKNVYYTGTKEEWEKITIGSSNEPLKNATIHYNS